jgi:TusA-related sulfurtransferase
VGQTASYAVGTGMRLAVLCVLDCSKKKQPAFPAEDGIEILANEQNGTSVYVVTVLIQGNLARPSSFSR